MPCPFVTLGIPETSTEKQILKAWRKLAKQHHPDKTSGNPEGETDYTRMKELNEAKEACLSALFAREYSVDELEFARFVARKLEKSINHNCDL